MEIWKPITGYEGLYEVSSLGNVRSVQTGKTLKGLRQGSGYVYVALYKNKSARHFRLHRIVAREFCGAGDGLEVNHIDNDPTNNSASNLEWVTHKENIAHSMRQGRKMEALEAAHRRAKEETSKAVVMIADDGTRKTYCPISSVFGDGYDPSCVSKCAKGKIAKHHGVRWEYV